MPTPKITKMQVGLYWGKEGIALSAISDKQVIKSIALPFHTELQNAESLPIPDELKPTALIKQAILLSQLPITRVNLTLSTKDFIFRPFAIPWMSELEARSVVSFEATKYIPIALEELHYTYHTHTYTDNNQKFYRVLFFAARKDLLARYTASIEQTGLQVDHIEPEPVSLVRLLLQQKRFSPKQSSAIVVVSPGEGKLFIADMGIVQFVREFQMPEDFSDATAIRVKLFNEVRISFSFYMRQNTQGKIDSILLLTPQSIPALNADLAREFNKPATCLTLRDFIPGLLPEVNDIGLLSAFGNAVREEATAAREFELSERIKTQRGQDATSKKEIQKMLLVAGIVTGCIIVSVVTNIFCGYLQKRLTNQIESLQKKSGYEQALSNTDLDKLTQTTTAKLNTYRTVRTHSVVTEYIYKVPTALAAKAWLKSFSISDNRSFIDSTKEKVAPTLSLDGYAYLPSPNEQYHYVMTMVDKIKSDPEWSTTYPTISLDSMSQTKLGDNVVVTAFHLTLK